MKWIIGVLKLTAFAMLLGVLAAAGLIAGTALSTLIVGRG